MVNFIEMRSEEPTSELQSHSDLVCRLLLVKKMFIHPSSTSYRLPIAAMNNIASIGAIRFS